MATITLVYSLPIPPTLGAAAFLSLVQNADIFQGELALLSMTVGSDTTVQAGDNIVRTIELETDATSDSYFPTDALKQAATYGLYKDALALKVPGQVTESAPSVAP